MDAMVQLRPKRSMRAVSRALKQVPDDAVTISEMRTVHGERAHGIVYANPRRFENMGDDFFVGPPFCQREAKVHGRCALSCERLATRECEVESISRNTFKGPVLRTFI